MSLCYGCSKIKVDQPGHYCAECRPAEANVAYAKADPAVRSAADEHRDVLEFLARQVTEAERVWGRSSSVNRWIYDNIFAPVLRGSHKVPF